MSHFVNHQNNFQNLSCLIKMLKIIDLKNLSAEKEKRQKSRFNISISLFNSNEFFSF